MPIDKRVGSAAEALADVKDGATVLISGFGGAGFPNMLIRALVRADTSDRYGNLTYRYAQMNFGLAMATAASTVVAEVRETVAEPIPFDRVGCPGIYIDRVVVAEGVA